MVRKKRSKAKIKPPDHQYQRTRATSSFEPSTFNEKTRSVRATIATENPVLMPDWERMEMIPEALLMSGLRTNKNGVMPLQNSHRTSSIFDTLGSISNMATPDGRLDGDVTFSSDDDGDKAMGKVRDGHIRTFSVGYTVFKSAFIPENETQRFGEKEFTGPMRVVTDWSADEGSLTAFPADADAEARSEKEVKSSAEAAENKGGSFRMNPKLLALLFQRGLASGSTEEEGLAFLRALSEEEQKKLRTEAGLLPKEEPKPSVVAQPDPEAEKRKIAEGVKRELDRQKEIRVMCEVGGIDEKTRDAWLEDSTISPDNAARKILEEMKKKNSPVGIQRKQVSGGLTEGEKFRSAVIDGVLIRQKGIEIKSPASGFEDFTRMPPSRIAEECLRAQGISTRTMSKAEIVKRAMKRGAETIAHGSDHYPYILESIATKMALLGFAEEESIWEYMCAVRPVSDFRQFSVTGLSGAADLEQIEELAPYTEGKFNEMREKATLAKYGRKFSVSWEAQLADDLGEFTTVPRRHGQSAKRLLNKLAIAIFTTNAAMNDNTALIHSDHSNSQTGALSTDGLNTIEVAMGKQTGHGIDSEALNIPLNVLLTGRQLRRTARILCLSETLPESGMPSGVPNPFKGIIPVATSLISSDTAYYGLADPNKYDVMVMAFLDGKQTPDVEQILQMDVDGLVWRIRMCAVAKATDWLGIQYSTGA